MYNYILLGLLKYKSMTGYELRQFGNEVFSSFTQISFGIIYPTLAKLLENSFVSMEEFIVNGRLQKKYSITQEGEIYFKEWLESPLELVKGQQKELVRIFFMSFLDKSKRIKIISDFIKVLDFEIIYLKTTFLEKRNIEDRFQNHTVLYGISYYENLVAWCKKLLEQ